MKKIFAAVILICLMTGACLADSSKGSWDNVLRTKPGRNIQLVTTNATQVRGKLLQVSNDHIIVAAQKGEVSIERSEVRRVEVRKGYKRVLHALAGAGLGVLVGAAIVFSRDGETEFYNALAAVPVLAGGGAAAGSFIPGYSTIYRVP